MEEIGLTQQTLGEYDVLAKAPKKPMVPLPRKERKARFANQAWRLVQETKGGGGASVPTKAYPEYEERVKEKAAAPHATPKTQAKPTMHSTSSSSTSWNQSSWQNQSWETAPWHQK